MIENLSERIKKIREDAGDNPNAASKRLGLSRTGYIKWEDGGTENMKLKNLMNFCSQYHVDLVTLLTGRENSNDTNKARQPTADYKIDPESLVVVDYYNRLPPAKQLDVRLAMIKYLLEAKVEDPTFDTGDLGQLIELKR